MENENTTDHANLRDHFAAFVNAAWLVWSGFKAAASRTHTAEGRRSLATAVEGVSEFLRLAEVVLETIPRYGPAPIATVAWVLEKSRSGEVLHADESVVARSIYEIQAFLRRVGFYRELSHGRLWSPEDLMKRLVAETTERRSMLTRLVLIDGLAVEGVFPVTITDGVKLRLLGGDAWIEFFESRTAEDVVPIEDLDGVWCFECSEAVHQKNWTVETPSITPLAQVSELVGPGLAYLNLWSAQAVRPAALFEKLSSRLTFPTVRALVITQLSRVKSVGLESEEADAGLVTVAIDDLEGFAEFVAKLEAGRLAGSLLGNTVAVQTWFAN